MKKLAILLTLLVASCATDKSIIHVQHKVLAHKYTERGNYYFQFFDGTIVVVDDKTYQEFRERETVRLTWRKK